MIDDDSPSTVISSFNITYTHITNAALTITGLPNPITISRGNSQTYTITVENPGNYSSISWSIAGTSISGTGASFILDANNPAYNAIGIDRELSLSVMIGSTPYQKIIPFRVAQ